MSQYQFSIIIPTYNEERYLPTLLDDLARQNFSDFEVIIIDSDSLDETKKIAREYRHKMDINIKNVTKNITSYKRKIGIELSQGKYLVLINADHRVSLEFLNDLNDYLLKNDHIDLFTCDIDKIYYSKKNLNIIRSINFFMQNCQKITPHFQDTLLGIKKDRLFLQPGFVEGYFTKWIFINNMIEEGRKYEYLHYPKYYYSLRRFKHNNRIEIAQKAAQDFINFLLNGDKNSRTEFLNLMNSLNPDQKFIFLNRIKETMQIPQEKLSELVKSFREF